MKKPLRWLFVMVMLAPFHASFAQTIGREPQENITIDFSTGVGKPKFLPFDVPFALVGKVPKEIVEISVSLVDKRYACNGVPCPDVCKSCNDPQMKLEDVEAAITQNVKDANDLNTKLKERKKFVWQTYRWANSKLRSKRAILLEDLAYYRNESNAKSIQAFAETQISTLQPGFNEIEVAGGKNTKKRNLKTKDKERLERDIKMFSSISTNCSCSTCGSKISKMRCIKICPWHIGFFSDKAEPQPKAANGVVVKDDSSYFKIEIPALPANREFVFYFQFKRRPATDESTNLKTIIESQIFALYDSMISNELPKGTTVLKPAVTLTFQRKFPTLIADFYENNLSQKVNVTHPIFQDGNRPKFADQIVNSSWQYAPATSENIFKSMNLTITDYDANALKGTAAPAYWSAFITDPLWTKIRAMAVADQEPLLKILNDFAKLDRGSPGEIERLIKGRLSIDDLTTIATRNLQGSRSSAEVQEFNVNISKLISFIDGLRADISVKISSSAPMMAKILTTNAEVNTTLSKLAQLKTLCLTSQNFILAYKKQWQSIEAIITGNASTLVKTSLEFTNNSTLSSTSNFVTRTEWYVSADVGLAYVQYEPSFVNKVVPYFGVNFNLAPINRQRKYRLFYDRDCLDQWYKNLSLIVGITMNDMAITNKRENTFSGRSLLTGFGLRIADPTRISFGCTWNNVRSDNPLLDEYKLRVYPYVSFSFDIDVGKYLGFLGTTLFPGTFPSASGAAPAASPAPKGN